MNKKIVGLALALSISSTFANPWTECGIGGALGSLVEKKPLSNFIASSSNLIWDLGTTATTSAISTPEICANKGAQSAKFINDTYENLEAETAKGQGETLASLMDIMQVEESSRASVIAEVRSEFSKVIADDKFNTMSTTEKAKAYWAVVMTASKEA